MNEARPIMTPRLAGEGPADGPGLDRRRMLIGATFMAASAFAALRVPRGTVDYLGKQSLEDIVPKRIGSWSFVSSSGLVVPPEDQLARAIYSQLLTRVYTDHGNSPVMFLVAGSGRETGVLQIHRPEICYMAGGFQLSPVRHVDVPVRGGIVRTVCLSATSDVQTEHLMYWTRIGDHMPGSWGEQRWDVALDNLKGVNPDAALVRASTISDDANASFALLTRFIQTLLQQVGPEARRVLAAGLGG